MYRADRKSRGFSLIELLVACSLFMGLLAIVFFFFRYGTRAFFTASQRQGVQADALRVMDGLQNDLKRTSAASVLTLSRQRSVDGVGLARDALSFVALKDWSPQDTASFDPQTARPRWNRYWVYYAGTDRDRGSVIRLYVDPNPPPIAPLSLTNNELSALTQDNPALNRHQGLTPAFSELTRNVHQFSVSRVGRGEYRVLINLREFVPPRPGAGAAGREEAYQLVMNVRCENTFPPLSE